MKKHLFLTLFLAQWFAVSAWCQGFGNRELIDDGWSFHLGDVTYGGAEYFDASGWRTLNLPHDWSVESTASPALASCTGYLPGGIGWYRKDLNIPAEAKGRRVFIYFEGVYNNSEVFINGKWVGKRPNGYVSFMYDLTPYIHYGGRNVLAVRVDHSQDADSRWYTGSGIYRDVYLVYANPVHIHQWGVSYAATVGKGNATLSVRTEIDNQGKSSCGVKVQHEVFNSQNTKVASGTGSCSVAPDGTAFVATRLAISRPELWNLDNPCLYTLRTTVLQNGKVEDRTETKVGLRSLTFNPDKGFALNGRYMKVKGVCIHHDAGCLGSAVPKEVWRRRLMQLKSLGCNAIRLSHNPQAPCLYDLCDELGLLVMDEAFDEWEYPKKKWIAGWNKGTPGFQGSSSYFREWSKRDVADMVCRDRNHPSVMMWSIGNEVDYPNDPYSHPVLDKKEGTTQQYVRGYLKGQPRAERLGDIAKELAPVVRKYDSSRPVTAALAGAVMSNETDYPGALDVVGYNYTEYRYKQDHTAYPKRVFYGSETGHGLDAWKVVRDNDYIFGQFLWSGYDYLGESGVWPSRGFTTGLIDLAGNIKPQGYFRRALWSESPVVYVGAYPLGKAGKWMLTNAPAIWNYEDGEQVRVAAYTNCDEAELYLNGRRIGERKPYDDKTAVIYWDIPYSAGVLKVVGYKKGKTVADDEIRTSGLPYAVKASLDRTEKLHAGDCLHLLIHIEDEQGIPVVLADNEVTCEIQGPARLLGLESSYDNAADNFRDNIQRCKNGKLLGYVFATGKGTVTIKLTSPLLKPAVLTFQVK